MSSSQATCGASSESTPTNPPHPQHTPGTLCTSIHQSRRPSQAHRGGECPGGSRAGPAWGWTLAGRGSCSSGCAPRSCLHRLSNEEIEESNEDRRLVIGKPHRQAGKQVEGAGSGRCSPRPRTLLHPVATLKGAALFRPKLLLALAACYLFYQGAAQSSPNNPNTPHKLLVDSRWPERPAISFARVSHRASSSAVPSWGRNSCRGGSSRRMVTAGWGERLKVQR